MKLNKSQLSIGILFLSLSVVGILFAFSKLSPSASPSSTYHSLNDIYTLITAGTEKATPNSALTTSSSPSATTSHSTTEIYLLLANKFKQENLRPGTNIFGITGVFGTPDAGYTLATSSAVSSSLTPTYTTDTLPTYTLGDIYNLVYGNTRITTPNHTFSSSPSASMYTTTQIYDALKNLKTNVLSSTKYGTTTSIFGVTGTFEPTAQLNDWCGSNDECFTGWCDYGSVGVCTNGAVGDSCYYNDSCASGYCDDISTYSCTDGSSGSGCGSNSSCAAPNVCDTGTYTCVDGSNGAACTSALGCSSGHCYGDVCTAGTTAVDGCDSSDDCTSGFCNTVGNICSAGTPGSACGGNSECDTYNCVSNVCSADLPLITSGLVGYWPFEETSGTTTNDLSSGNHDGVFSTGVAINQSGKIGTSFGFDGTGIIEVSSSLGLGTVMTVSTWAYLPESTSGSIVNLGCADTNWGCSSSGIGIGMGDTTFDDLGNNFFIVNNGIAWDEPVTSIGAGWHHIAVVMENSTVVKQYIDGVYRKSYSYLGSPFVPLAGTDTIKIGGYFGDYTRLFTGKIDELAIWDRPLSPADITNLYNGGAGMSIITP